MGGKQWDRSYWVSTDAFCWLLPSHEGGEPPVRVCSLLIDLVGRPSPRSWCLGNLPRVLDTMCNHDWGNIAAVSWRFWDSDLTSRTIPSMCLHFGPVFKILELISLTGLRPDPGLTGKGTGEVLIRIESALLLVYLLASLYGHCWGDWRGDMK